MFSVKENTKMSPHIYFQIMRVYLYLDKPWEDLFGFVRLLNCFPHVDVFISGKSEQVVKQF